MIALSDVLRGIVNYVLLMAAILSCCLALMAVYLWRIFRQLDREFYDRLGPERADVPCRKAGCSRGAVKLSVFCRVHHYEQIQKCRCPFRH